MNIIEEVDFVKNYILTDKQIKYGNYISFIQCAIKSRVKNCRINFWISKTDEKSEMKKFIVTLQSSTSYHLDDQQYVVNQSRYSNYTLYLLKVDRTMLEQQFTPVFDKKVIMNFTGDHVLLSEYYDRLNL
jgi:hypothetical protein